MLIQGVKGAPFIPHNAAQQGPGAPDIPALPGLCQQTTNSVKASPEFQL